MAGMLGSYNMQKSWECLTNKPWLHPFQWEGGKKGDTTKSVLDAKGSFCINIFKSMKGRLVLYDKVDMAGTMSLDYNEVVFNWTTGKIS